MTLAVLYCVDDGISLPPVRLLECFIASGEHDDALAHRRPLQLELVDPMKHISLPTPL